MRDLWASAGRVETLKSSVPYQCKHQWLFLSIYATLGIFFYLCPGFIAQCLTPQNIRLNSERGINSPYDLVLAVSGFILL